jgi:hypothetical protein
MAKGLFDPDIFDSAIFDTGSPFASVDWTGVEHRLAADPQAIAEITKRIAELDALVETLGLTNSECDKAKAITTALRTLVSSPEPEWRAIIALLASPTMTALCNAITVGTLIASIIRLIVG